jgi:hypothetical protein
MQKLMQNIFGLSLVVFLIVACNSAVDPVFGFRGCPTSRIQDYSLATSVNGELTASDCVYPENSKNYIDYYKLKIDKLQDFTSYFEPESFNRELILFNSEGKVIETVYNNRTLSKQLTPGEYIVALQSSSAEKTGKYTFVTTTPEKGFGGCLDLPKYELGTLKEDSLTVNDCFYLNVNSHVKYYELKIDALEDVTFDYDSIDYTTFFALYSRDGKTSLAPNYYQRTVSQQLKPGIYVIATSSQSNGTGKFQLKTTTSSKGFGGCLNVTDNNYVIGSTVQGNLSVEDCKWPNSKARVDYYFFNLPESKTLAITFDSSEALLHK